MGAGAGPGVPRLVARAGATQGTRVPGDRGDRPFKGRVSRGSPRARRGARPPPHCRPVAPPLRPHARPRW
eukprot:6163009-Pleurochrysis_carterae.AAC.1